MGVRDEIGDDRARGSGINAESVLVNSKQNDGKVLAVLGKSGKMSGRRGRGEGVGWHGRPIQGL